jgi:DNA-directed RNA polymerase II subunit RPB2
MDSIPEAVARKIFRSYFAEKGLYNHLIESYDEMFRVWLPHMIAEFGRIIVCSEKTQTLHLVTILPPTEIRKPQKREKLGYVSDLSIREARDRGLTYEAAVITDIVHEVYSPSPGAPRIELPRREGLRTVPPAISTIRPLPGMVCGEGSAYTSEDTMEPTTLLLLRHAGMAVPVPWIASSDVLEGIVSPTAQWTMDDSVTCSAFDSEDLQRAKPNPELFTLIHRSVSKDVKLFSLPVMVGSNRCHTRDQPPAPADPWNRQEAYCVVNGMEKIFMPQLNPIANTVIVKAPTLKNELQTVQGQMRCRHWSKIRATATMYIEVTSSYRGTGMVLASIRLPFIEHPIPLFAFMRLVGFKTIDEAAWCIAQRGYARPPGPEAASSSSSSCSAHALRYVLWLKSALRNRAPNALNFETASMDEIMLWVGEHCLKKEKTSSIAQALAASMAGSMAPLGSEQHGSSAPQQQQQQQQQVGGPTLAAVASDGNLCTLLANRKYIQHILSNEFLPQVGLDMSDLTLSKKRMLLCFIVWRVCKVARHEMPPDDRDHFGNQMIETPGRLVIHLLRQLYRNALQKRTIKMLKMYADSGRHFTPADCIPSRKLTNDLGYAMSTGSWGVQKSGSARKGIIQVFKRINPLASISNLRSFKKPGDIKDMAPRLLKTHDWGIACPSETSEGENCGLLKHLAGHATITQGRPTRQLLEAVVIIMGDRLIETAPLADGTAAAGTAAAGTAAAGTAAAGTAAAAPPRLLLMVNGIMLGWIRDGGTASQLVKELRLCRRRRLLPSDAEIYHSEQHGAVYVSCENGAVRRPLIVVGGRLEELVRIAEQQPEECLFSELVRRGFVEFVGKNEEMELVVRADPTVYDEVDDWMSAAGGIRESGEAAAVLEAVGVDTKALSAETEALRQRLTLAGGFSPGEIVRQLLELKRARIREALGISADRVARGSPQIGSSYTHMEIHPTAIHSLSTALIPFSNYNQAPRNTYQCAMGKAALGEPQEVDESRSYMRLMDAQVPLVQTFNESMLNERYMRSGVNVIVAIVCFEGNNEEDSLNLCRSDLHLGMFRTWDYRVYADTASTTSRADPQVFERPDDSVLGKRDSDYSLLGEGGFVPPGTIVRGGTVVIGKTVRVSGDRTTTTATATAATNGPGSAAAAAAGGAGIKRDQSVITDESAPSGIVTNVVFADSKERKRIKLQVARPAIPIIGDKFSARHGQKGVMGDKIAREDMPWGMMPMQVRDAKTGKVTGVKMTEIRPNILMNPNAIPSRMTVGQLLEMVAGTAAAAGGYIADGTSFSGMSQGSGLKVDELRDELSRLGLKPSGTVKLNSGITGEELYNAEVFMGVCLYQRLKQLAEAKARAVDRGLTSALTRQPMEGKNGGLRAGEMERDAFIAHGAPRIIVNTYLERSDDYVAYACTKCGMLACPPRKTDDRLRHLTSESHFGMCTFCQSSEHIARFRTPYGLKLMTQELMTLGIVPRFDVHASNEIDFANAPAPGVPAHDSTLPRFQSNTPTGSAAPTAALASPTAALASPTAALASPGSPAAPSTAAVSSLPGGSHIKGPDIVEGSLGSAIQGRLLSMPYGE